MTKRKTVTDTKQERVKANRAKRLRKRRLAVKATAPDHIALSGRQVRKQRKAARKVA